MLLYLMLSIVIFSSGDHSVVLSMALPSCTVDGICHNGGVCEEQPFTDKEYLCKCTDEYHGSNCENRLPIVDCRDNQIVLSVEKSLLMAEAKTTEAKFVYLGGEKFSQQDCVAVDKGNDVVITLRPPFTGCGTSSTTNGSTLTYRNRLYLDTTRNSSIAEGKHIVLLDWSCVYVTKYRVSFPFGIQPGVIRPEKKTSFGKFTLDLRVFQDLKYSEHSPLLPPAVLPVGQRLYAQVELTTSSYNGLAVTLLSCLASNKANPSSTAVPIFSHEVIEDGCPSWQDNTVQLHESSSSRKARFSFQMFMWSTNPAPVYLHCLVSLCNATRYGQNCQANCTKDFLFGRRNRRSMNNRRDMSDLHLSIGPYLLDREASFETIRKDQSQTNTTVQVDNKTTSKPEHIVVGVLVGLGSIMLFIIIIAVSFNRFSRHTLMNNFFKVKANNADSTKTHCRSRSA